MFREKTLAPKLPQKDLPIRDFMRKITWINLLEIQTKNSIKLRYLTVFKAQEEQKKKLEKEEQVKALLSSKNEDINYTIKTHCDDKKIEHSMS
jgi:hypothetical protein